jgi:hypothetical protein
VTVLLTCWTLPMSLCSPYWGVEIQLHAFFDLGTRWRWVVSFTPRPLYPPGKNPGYPLDMRLGGTQSRSGRGGEEKSSQHLPGLEPPFIQPVAQRYTTKLSRFTCGTHWIRGLVGPRAGLDAVAKKKKSLTVIEPRSSNP